ncbi:acetolactate synthase 2 catalytic subunit [Endozoicomonas sp. SM1973]|uniref:Acetolactate synthase n=1 Tax=Spartinivicinus marinus TaxID=2994442 RepID=A0A853IAR6_9GAMM|nr:acetolactate synthase 2 catalytic subunit [Spartinivicinus marinus]MCX4025339.1 acetolactate synthase 2 catalytic subunit [Spartinivicinus marinus]NYZ68912.1 acetolactate synthase 2 catalytic subunit [Spartinivicinus marinus]
MNGAQHIIKTLETAGISTLFGYPGGAIMPVYDALVDSKLNHVLCRHEQGAALAADGYARSTGKLGVCLATSGPGATNLLTGIANAHLDSIPMLAITGQVASPFIGTDAFQEVDILGMALPVVKHSFQVRAASELPWMLLEAMQIAMSGRPGPVLIDVPKDIQLAEIPSVVGFPAADYSLPTAGAGTIEEANLLIEQAKCPLLYSGGGIMLGGAVTALRKYAQRSGIPSVSTLKGIGNHLPEDPYYLGMLGMHGTKAANLAVQQCDLLICIGARFDDRVTGKLDSFAANAKIIHLDIDAAEFGKLKIPDVIIHGELNYSLNQLTSPAEIGNWQQHCVTLKSQHAFTYPKKPPSIYAPQLINRLSQLATEETIISCDVGQHQMWVAQHYQFTHPRHHLSSSGLGTMGYGLPAAIGAQFANPDAQVINISGDGSFMMNIQELATIIRYQLPIKIIIIDNQRLGMVRQWQTLFFTERYSEVDLSDNPDFVKVAQAFGLTAQCINQAEDVEPALQTLLKATTPFLLHVCINPKDNVWPLVPPGVPNDKMLECTKNELL